MVDLSSTTGVFAMEQEVKVIKSAQCPSVSGKSKLTYEFGLKEEGGVQFRITRNSGGGMFGKDWVPMSEVIKVLKDPLNQEAIGAFAFRQIFEGKSINTQSFLLAALKNEEVVTVHPTTRRAYQVFDVAAFEERINGLIEGKQVGSSKGADVPNKRPVLKVPVKKTEVSAE